MLKIKDLVNTCQNQWKGLFGYDPEFSLVLRNETKRQEKQFRWVEIKDKEWYINQVRNYEVLYWEYRYKTLIIDFEEKDD